MTTTFTHEPTVYELQITLDSLRELIKLQFEASKEAVLKAEVAQQNYNVRSNEFRGQLDDQAKRLIARTEVEQLLKSMQDRIEAANKSLEEKISVNDREIRAVRENVGTTGGKVQGANESWNRIVQIVQMAAALGIGVTITKLAGH